jgi:hypothetical protein
LDEGLIVNERIQALAEQAEKYASEKDGKYDGAGNLNWQWQDIKMEKFADSLVWECMKICEDVMKKDNSALACWSAIKGTFRS